MESVGNGVCRLLSWFSIFLPFDVNAFQNLSFFPSFFPPQNLGIVPVYCVACIHVMDLWNYFAII